MPAFEIRTSSSPVLAVVFSNALRSRKVNRLRPSELPTFHALKMLARFDVLEEARGAAKVAVCAVLLWSEGERRKGENRGMDESGGGVRWVHR